MNGPIHLAPYDPGWPAQYEQEADRLSAVLGDRMLAVHHVGSTSVPGLPAKPIIDIVMAVADSEDETTYVPDLEAAGYTLRIREPEWFEHRMFKGPGADINLHVFTLGCTEIDRMIRFRDRLRSDEQDRQRYTETKQELAAHHWDVVQSYADAKSDVVRSIMKRATESTDS
ncbi:MAG: GrpB family protein [Acidimicrobiia bacterium]|nr:GrpB family protein [Acidimicrobiia bacterium]